MHILHTHVSQWIRTAVYVIDKLSLINLSVTFYWHSSYVSYYRLAHPINFRKCIRFINGLNSEFSYQSRCQSAKIIKEDQIYLDLETKYFIYLSLFLWVFWRNTTNGSSYRFKRYFYFWNLNFPQWIMFSYFLIWLLMLHWWSGLQFDANAFWILCSGIKFGIFLCFEIGLGVILLALPVKSGLLEYGMGTWISSKIFEK